MSGVIGQPFNELMRELCEVMDRQQNVALEVMNLGIDCGRMERMGKLVTRAQQLKQKILGDPWVSVTRDQNGAWVLKDGRTA